MADVDEDVIEEPKTYSAEEYDAVTAERDEAIASRDELQGSIDSLTSERDSLAAQLDDAKTKFANAFLSSPEKMKETQRQEIRAEEKPASFESLFSGRNPTNAN